MRKKRDGEAFREFTHDGDYLPYVDGKPRYQGVKSFLESRKINIPFGDPSDTPDKETVCGIGNRKNLMFNEALKKQGAEIFSSTVGIQCYLGISCAEFKKDAISWSVSSN